MTLQDRPRRAAMVAAARACLGTPFHHQGRLPGVGLDCIGLIVVAASAAGYEIADATDYARQPEEGRLLAGLSANGLTASGAAQAGDVLLFRFDGGPRHAALMTGEDRMIHAFAPVGQVVETGMGDFWRRRLCGAFRFPD